jgi:hypothetical protein
MVKVFAGSARRESLNKKLAQRSWTPQASCARRPIRRASCRTTD